MLPRCVVVRDVRAGVHIHRRSFGDARMTIYDYAILALGVVLIAQQFWGEA